ncbi:unnamed protein product [Moneuplotes crassus]|uniref:Uncharacterized protein n=1 Tax=Euplotes crassus TaxID=5936 RepID=A0AAD1Y0X3_EUPCR|nr:unnamed protein product [Moneuplotes crassus]
MFQTKMCRFQFELDGCNRVAEALMKNSLIRDHLYAHPIRNNQFILSVHCLPISLHFILQMHHYCIHKCNL